MLGLVFPPKCTLCRKLLTKEETDLCHHCREHTEVLKRTKRNIPFVAHWTALWYYKEDVRNSVHRFKFGYQRRYAAVYGRLLAVKIGELPQTDVLSWIPVSRLRRLKRGYDQSQLLAAAVAQQLNVAAIPVLKKIRHTPPQSSIWDPARRRANVLGAYRVKDPAAIAGKRILLLDDVVTTGATASECARVLLIAGAKEVYIAAVAAAQYDKK